MTEDNVTIILMWVGIQPPATPHEPYDITIQQVRDAIQFAYNLGYNDAVEAKQP